jgi:epoxide hydrolase-like predicted phosphatase
MIKAVFFDIGGVVTHTDFDALYRNFEQRAGLPPGFVQGYHKKNLDDLLLGNISAEQFWSDMKGSAEDPIGVWQEGMKKARTVDLDLLQMIDQLRSRVKTGTITNLTESRLICDEADGIFEHFDVLALSCRDHVKKPDPEFFHLALARGGVDPEESVFIDDKASLAGAASALGMHGVVYENKEGLATEGSIRHSREKLLRDLHALGLGV